MSAHSSRDDATRSRSPSTEDHRADAPTSVRCAVLTISDTRTAETDRSGELVRQSLRWRGHDIIAYEIVPDDVSRIIDLLQEWIATPDIQAIITNGGTGIAGRDNTYEAIVSLLDKQLQGFGEIFRMLSYGEIGAAAMLSRAVAGVAAGTAIFSVPGSSNAVTLAMEKLIGPEIGHVVLELTK
ncbi:MAG: Molybdenum cofactor biosynthesis protein MoaB [uncultured Thermomicrobiales bacterium]|uniref:Molybdenum cofactor biosynthesis protein B n=1 Tax=uncultured Thermomicrobiales bacterium TaxID=1645740 RepID=A0A6J4UM00_9BACT|nr:MAG: Molybdenum cofactor biosynthesis protein MoaB [uncultured Thermomicrobiales bacterium]